MRCFTHKTALSICWSSCHKDRKNSQKNGKIWINKVSVCSPLPIPPINKDVIIIAFNFGYCTLSNVNSRRLSISSKIPKSEVTFPIGIIRIVSCPIFGSLAEQPVTANISHATYLLRGSICFVLESSSYFSFRTFLKNVSILSKGIISRLSYKSTWLAPEIISSSLLSPVSRL